MKYGMVFYLGRNLFYAMIVTQCFILPLIPRSYFLHDPNYTESKMIVSVFGLLGGIMMLFGSWRKQKATLYEQKAKSPFTENKPIDVSFLHTVAMKREQVEA